MDGVKIDINEEEHATNLPPEEIKKMFNSALPQLKNKIVGKVLIISTPRGNNRFGNFFKKWVNND